MAAIVRSLKQFAHADTREMAQVDLNRAIESTLTISRNEYKNVAALRPGMVFASDVAMTSGMLVVTRGFEVTGGTSSACATTARAPSASPCASS